MAQVDFSNAVLDVNPNTYQPPMNNNNFMGMSGGAGYLYDQSYNILASGNLSVLLNTPSKVSLLFTGAFGTGGTEFYFGSAYYNISTWKVSNISFNSGDTYSFVIDIEVSGNT